MYIAQHERLPVVLCQRAQGLDQSFSYFRALQGCRGNLTPVFEVLRNVCLAIVFVIRQRQHRYMPLFSISHSRLIDGYLNQPGTEARLFAELIQTGQRLQKRILRYVLSVLLIREQSEHRRINRPLMGADELHERLFVPREDPIDQSPFRGSGRTLVDSGGQAFLETIFDSRLPLSAEM